MLAGSRCVELCRLAMSSNEADNKKPRGCGSMTKSLNPSVDIYSLDASLSNPMIRPVHPFNSFGGTFSLLQIRHKRKSSPEIMTAGRWSVEAGPPRRGRNVKLVRCLSECVADRFLDSGHRSDSLLRLYAGWAVQRPTCPDGTVSRLGGMVKNRRAG